MPRDFTKNTANYLRTLEPPPSPVATSAFVGFGKNVVGARGGSIIHVTNLNDSGAGSFRAAVTASGQRFVVFDVSGTIQLTSGAINITNPFLHIAGQTAPAPGIQVRGAQFNIFAREVIIQHITFRNSKNIADADRAGNGDSLGIQCSAGSTVENIVIDHCTMQWAADELIMVWNLSETSGIMRNITFQYCLACEGLFSRNVIFGGTSSTTRTVPQLVTNVTMWRNIMANTTERFPRIRENCSIEVRNNYAYNAGSGTYCLVGNSGFAIQTPSWLSFRDNYYVAGPLRTTDLEAIGWEDGAWATGSKCYINGNVLVGFDRLHGGNSNMNNAVTAVGGTPGVGGGTLPANMDSGITAGQIIAPGTALRDHLCDYVGSRPINRDAQVLDVINNCRTQSGGISASSVAGYGGPVTFANNTSVWPHPANPNGDDNLDGITNIEDVLAAQSDAVIGW